MTPVGRVRKFRCYPAGADELLGGRVYSGKYAFLLFSGKAPDPLLLSSIIVSCIIVLQKQSSESDYKTDKMLLALRMGRPGPG